MKTRLRNNCTKLNQRWILAAMCFLALCNAYSMRSCLAIAITKMAGLPPTSNDNPEEETCPSPVQASSSETLASVTVTSNQTSIEGLYEWDERTQGWILSSFYLGYVLTHIPGGIISDKYGGKHTLGIGIFLTAIFTIVTPIVVDHFDSTGLIILRVLMGFGEGTTFPAINVLLAQWIPPKERSRAGSFVYAGCFVGIIFSTLSSGLLLHNYPADVGWRVVFYCMGSVGVIWFVIWCLLCYNTPQDHPFITEEEEKYLKEMMGDHLQSDGNSSSSGSSSNNNNNKAVPWRYILRSKPLWAVVIGLLGYNWCMMTILNDLPKYMHGVLKVDVLDNSYVSTLVYFFTWIGSVTSSYPADYLIAKDVMSITAVRKAGTTIALSGAAIFIVSASYAGCDKYLVVALFSAAMFIIGVAIPSTMINALDLSPNYAGSLMALTNGISALSGFGAPFLIGELTQNQSLAEWRLVFWILFGVSIASNLVFLLFASGQVQPWNDPDYRAKKRIEDSRIEENSH